MKIKLIVVGKTHKSFLLEGEQEYVKRMKKYISFEKIEISDLKNAKNLTLNQIKQEEGQLILSKLDKGAMLVLLDEKGKEYTSVNFANWIQSEMNRGHKSINFVVCGAYGFSEEIYQIANQKIALSKMTFSHQMVRLFFIEQVYRAYTILNNEPYHHE